MRNCSSTQEVLASIRSDDVFSMDGIIVTDSGNYVITDYYDFSVTSKYEIAEWAYENDLISEEEKIDCYCDLVIKRNFDNIECLTGVFYEIQRYREESNISFELETKIDKLLEANEYSPTGAILPNIEGLYENAYFRILYDPEKVSASAAESVGAYFAQVRAQFVRWGFIPPLSDSSKYVVQLDCNKNENNYAGVTVYVPPTSDSNVCASSIIIYEFTSLTDDVKRTIAHELFHAVQKSYNYQYNWFGEACATFISLIYHKDSAIGEHLWEIYEFINSIETVSLATLPNNKGYGAAIFPLTIYMDFGGMNTIVKIYEEYNNHAADISFSEFREVINNGMASNGYSDGFNNAYRKMTCYVLRVDDSSFGYGKELAESRDWWSNKEVTPKFVESTISKTGSVSGLTSKYYRFRFPSNFKGTVAIVVTFSSTQNGYTQTYYLNNNVPTINLNTKTLTVSTFTQSQIGNGVSQIYLVVSNLSNSSNLVYTIKVNLTAS